MPQAGVPARARRRYAAQWSEELDGDAFRFPTAYEVTPAPRAVARTAEREVARNAVALNGDSPVRAPVAAVPSPARTANGSTSVARKPITPAPRANGSATVARRTVTIRGHGAERNLPVTRPTLRRHERPGFRPDRAALWAVMLGLLLILVAAASAHAAIPH